MKNSEKKVTCPKCGCEIDVNELIYRTIEADLSRKFMEDLSKEREKFEEKTSLLEEKEKSLDTEKKQMNDRIETKVRQGIKFEKKKIEDNLRKEIDEEKSEQFKEMQEELNRKTTQLKEFNKAQSEIARLKREKDEMESTIKADMEKAYSDKLKEDMQRLAKSQETENQFKIAEKEKVIDDLKCQLKEAQRKAEQGSMQLQGEVQEIAIEDFLKKSFPIDLIEEVKKGAFGADCLQTVNTTMRQNCGLIYYESKRTKGFQKSWIEKFKKDMRDKGVDIGILVTETMPQDMVRMGMKDGVWVCTYNEFKGLCFVLRESLIQISDVVSAQENKGEKMHDLYDYLTSNKFKLVVEAIVEGFTSLKSDLDSEKRAMLNIWNKREKQINKVLTNTSSMYGSIRGIAGSAVQPIRMLELKSDDYDDEQE